MNPFSFVELFRTRSKSPSYVDKSGAENFFGSIAANSFSGIYSGAQFIPADANGNTFDLRDPSTSAQWKNLGTAIMQEWAYRFCAPLASVIDRISEADSNGIFELRNLDNEIIKNYKYNSSLKSIMTLFTNPNPWQTREDFNTEQVIIAKKFGYCPVFMVRPVGFPKVMTKYMFNLDPTIVRPVINQEFTMRDPDAGGLILKWEFTYMNHFYSIDSDDVVVVRDGFSKDKSFETGLPISKIVGLDYAISNICAAMEAENVLLRKKGPLGIYTYAPVTDNMSGWKPLDNKAKAEIQGDLKNYGMNLGLLQHIVSKWPLKWQPISFNAQELMTKDITRAGIDMICDRFGHPAELMSGKNATYENRTSAERYMYQTTIIPFAARRMAIFTNWFGVEDICKLHMNFSHLPIMQEDVLKAGEAAFYDAQALDLDWKNGLISYDEYRTARGYDPVGGEIGKLLYPEYAKKMGIDINQSSVTINTKKNATQKNSGTKGKSKEQAN